MSTRSVIARTTDQGKTFSGVYHHWDGYPTALGRTLCDLFYGRFKPHLSRMLRALIDDHPEGWSTIIGADWSKSPDHGGPGPRNFNRSQDDASPAITQDNASGCGCEWAYAFDEPRLVLYILSSYHGDGTKAIGMFGMGDPAATWRVAGTIDLSKDMTDTDIEAVTKAAELGPGVTA